MKKALVAMLLLGTIGCPGGDDDCFVGDPAQQAEVELVYRTLDGETAAIAAGDPTEVPLIQPPQGGKVLLVGVRARNLVGCGLQLSASLRDECTDRILALEQRPVTLADDGSGWALPELPAELQNYANLPACPTAAAERDVEEEPYRLRIRVTDRQDREASAEAIIVPVCAEQSFEQLCKCECDGNYVLGQECTAEIDGGPPPGTCQVSDAGLARDGGA